MTIKITVMIIILVTTTSAVIMEIRQQEDLNQEGKLIKVMKKKKGYRISEALFLGYLHRVVG